jgi:hypothetical protein
MPNQQDFNQYGVSVAFEKVLSHTVPGVFFTFLIIMVLDLNVETMLLYSFINSLSYKIIVLGLIVCTILGFAFGLVIDEIHHIFIERLIYDKFTKGNDAYKHYDLNGKSHPENYFIPFLGLNLYKYNLKHFYSYSEFDANIGIVFFLYSFVAPFYINYYLNISILSIFIILSVFFLISILMIYAGYSAYIDYIGAFNDTLEGTLDLIKLETQGEITNEENTEPHPQKEIYEKQQLLKEQDKFKNIIDSDPIKNKYNPNVISDTLQSRIENKREDHWKKDKK